MNSADVVAVLQMLTQAGITAQQLTELYNKPDLTAADVQKVIDDTEATINRLIADD